MRILSNHWKDTWWVSYPASGLSALQSPNFCFNWLKSTEICEIGAFSISGEYTLIFGAFLFFAPDHLHKGPHHCPVHGGKPWVVQAVWSERCTGSQNWMGGLVWRGQSKWNTCPGKIRRVEREEDWRACGPCISSHIYRQAGRLQQQDQGCQEDWVRIPGWRLLLHSDSVHLHPVSEIQFP